MNWNEEAHDLPGWASVTPPPGGMQRLRQAMQQAPISTPRPWAMALGGAVTAVMLVGVVLLAHQVRHSSDTAQRIVAQASAYQQASRGFVPISGDEDAPVRVYVAMPRMPESRDGP